MQPRIALRLLVTVGSLAVVGAITPSSGDSAKDASPDLRCKRGEVRGVIAGRARCLRPGQRCQRRHDRRYHRYRFHCHTGRLARFRPKPRRPQIPPPRPIAGLAPAARVVGSITVAGAPGPIAVGEGAVWVRNANGTVSRVDPGSNSATTITAGGSRLGWIAAGNAGVWSSNYDSNSLRRIDSATNAAAQTIAVGPAPAGVAVTPGAVWVANHHGRSVSRISPATNSVVATVPIGDQSAPPQVGPQALASDGETVWLTSFTPSGPALEQLDPATNAVVRSVPITRRCGDLAADGSDVWAATSGCEDASISRVDAHSGAITATIPIGTASMAVAIGLGSVWVVGPSRLVRIDPQRNQVVGALELPTGAPDPSGLAVGFGAVWLSAGSGNVVWRLEP